MFSGSVKDFIGWFDCFIVQSCDLYGLYVKKMIQVRIDLDDIDSESEVGTCVACRGSTSREYDVAMIAK